MDCSTPGLPVHHQLPEFTQTHVHWVSDAIQSSHPLLSPSPPTFNLSQHQGLFKWVSSLHQVAKVLEFQYSCNYSYLKKKTIILTLYLLLLLVAYNYWVVGIALAFSQAFCTFTHLLLTTPSICAYKLLLQLCPMNLWTIAHQAPLSMGFCRQEYTGVVAMPSSRGSSWPWDWTHVLGLLHWQADSLPLCHQESPTTPCYYPNRLVHSWGQKPVGNLFAHSHTAMLTRRCFSTSEYNLSGSVPLTSLFLSPQFRTYYMGFSRIYRGL